MNKFYKFIYCTFRGVFKLIFRMEIKGVENQPAKGPYLICTNHQSNNDTICVAASTKNQLRFFAKKSLFKTHDVCYNKSNTVRRVLPCMSNTASRFPI